MVALRKDVDTITCFCVLRQRHRRAELGGARFEHLGFAIARAHKGAWLARRDRERRVAVVRRGEEPLRLPVRVGLRDHRLVADVGAREVKGRGGGEGRLEREVGVDVLADVLRVRHFERPETAIWDTKIVKLDGPIALGSPIFVCSFGNQHRMSVDVKSSINVCSMRRLAKENQAEQF
eukprot:6208464-Pleurochrysis_carterae.AAC.1